MAGDTWVALDGRNPDSWFRTCWISDVGTYTGALPPSLLTTSYWLPSDAYQLIYLFATPSPTGFDDQVGIGYTTDYYQQYFDHTSSPSDDASRASHATNSMHVFVAWFDIDPTHRGSVDPAVLSTPSALPLDLITADFVTGGRLVVIESTATFTFDALTLTVATGSHPVSSVAAFRLGYDSIDEGA